MSWQSWWMLPVSDVEAHKVYRAVMAYDWAACVMHCFAGMDNGLPSPPPLPHLNPR